MIEGKKQAHLGFDFFFKIFFKKYKCQSNSSVEELATELLLDKQLTVEKMVNRTTSLFNFRK